MRRAPNVRQKRKMRLFERSEAKERTLDFPKKIKGFSLELLTELELTTC